MLPIVELAAVGRSADLRQALDEIVEHAMADLPSELERLSVFAKILESLREQGWVPDRRLASWERAFVECLVQLDYEDVYDLEKIILLAEWMVSRREMFTPDEWDACRRGISAVVESEAYADVSPSTSEYWMGVRDNVARVEQVLDCSLRTALERIEQNIEAAENRTGEAGKIIDLRESPKRGSIDSMFEALLE
jgi:hypothetical protein